MDASTSQGDLLTSGAATVAIGHGVQRHHIDRLARRGLVPHQTAGHIRLFARADLESIRGVCRERGYYRPAVELVSS